MTEQLRCIGFDFNTQESLDRFFGEHWEKKTLIDMADGVYLRMDVRPDIACWLSVDPESQELLDWDMHLDNGSRLPCAFGEQLTADPLGQSGLVSLTLDPAGDEQQITAACPALAFWPERDTGAPGLVSLALYAGEMSAVTGAAEGIHAQQEDNLADVTGTVLSAERLKNSWSGLDFLHIRLRCRTVQLDLYAGADDDTRLPQTGTMMSVRAYVTCLCEAGVISDPGGNT